MPVCSSRNEIFVAHKNEGMNICNGLHPCSKLNKYRLCELLLIITPRVSGWLWSRPGERVRLGAAMGMEKREGGPS